jgi:hypothetical protein
MTRTQTDNQRAGVRAFTPTKRSQPPLVRRLAHAPKRRRPAAALYRSRTARRVIARETPRECRASQAAPVPRLPQFTSLAPDFRAANYAGR